MIQISDTILLRPFATSDAESIAKYANNLNIASNLRDSFPFPYNKSDAEHFIFNYAGHYPYKVFAIEVNNEAVGSVGFFIDNDIYRLNAEIGYWLAEHLWGKGIMSNIIPSVVEYAFSKFDLIRIYARPFPFNIASQKVLIKSGFRLEATIEKSIIKRGEIMDEPIYSILNLAYN
jgi:RimJ/RimL family protein N-acetyltransferase